ncbi:MAG: hypothetical protein OXQ28_07500 [Acidobacteriota bacterium]|nr:hypothetical protein [Acidobacteriota bacterium]
MMRSNESTYERPARQTRAVVASPLLAVGGGCGGATLVTTNADTFDRTFDAMDRGPAAGGGRKAVSRAIPAVHADAGRERILPGALPRERDADALPDRGLRPALARETIRSSGAAIDGKTAGELLATSRKSRPKRIATR